MKILQKRKIVIVLIMLVLSVIMISVENKDFYRTGDEVITYSMANGDDGGWMLSKGRVRNYLETRIIGESFGETISNLADAGVDVLKNRTNSEFFTFPRENETKVVTREEAESWFNVSSDTAFNFPNVYLNAMADDANSFFYYSLVHLMGSLFPGISSLKWSAFGVNLICFLVAFLLVYKCTAYFTDKSYLRLLMPTLWGASVGALNLTTYLRPYMLVTVFQTALIYLHLKLLSELESSNDKGTKKYILLLVPIYVAAYVSHYTTGILAVVLGIYTIIKMILKYKKPLLARRYIFTGCVAIILGFAIDPMSVMGLLSKLVRTTSAKRDLFGWLVETLTNNIFRIELILIVVVGLMVFNIVKACISKKSSNVAEMTVILAIYSILLTVLTKQPYFRGVFPMIVCMSVMNIIIFIEGVNAKAVSSRIVPVVMIFVTLIYGSVSYWNILNTKNTEGAEWKQIHAALMDNNIEELTLVRQGASAYEYFNLACEVENTYFITEDLPEDCGELLFDKVQSSSEGWLLVTGSEEYTTTLMEMMETSIPNRNIESVVSVNNATLVKWN